MQSKRKDGLGHWPKGKRRHHDAGDWQVVRLNLTALLDEHHEPGVISLGALAAALGTYPRTVHKWLKGIHVPDAETQELVKTWVRQQRERIAQARKRR